MLCYAIDQKASSIGSPTTASMYRNLHSDANPSPTNGFFQPGYAPKLMSTPSYPPSGYGVPQTQSSTSESSYGLGHEYTSPFYVPGVNHSEPTSSQSSWGSTGIYSNTNFPSVLSATGNWDPMGAPFHHPGTAPVAPSYPISGPMTQQPLVNGTGSPTGVPPTTLTGIECFSNGADAHSSVGLQLSSIHPGAMSAQRRPYEWINKNAYQNPQAPQGKTRTKDKYRVVYSDHQRLELEKEFRFSRYITIRRKAELAGQLCLSERQVKIWFQNRRAKERKANKKNVDSMKQNGDQDGDEADAGDDNVSEHSGHAMTSSPSMTQMQSASMPQIMGYGHGELPHDVSSSMGGVIHEHQDNDNVPLSAQHMSYPYDLPSPQGLNYVQMPGLDIKPIIARSDDPHVMTSPVDDVTTAQGTATPSASHQMQGNLDEL